MGKLELNKLQKQTSLLNTAFNLFTTKGVSKTSISEISEQAGIAKGTFYLYFKDKYDIRNKLISHESSKLFKNAAAALRQYCLTQENPVSLSDKIVFIVNHIIDALNTNKALLNFISKNLSWGIFKEALTNNIEPNDVDFRHVFFDMIKTADISIDEPEIMLFIITELVSSTAYSSILYSEPTDIKSLKPYLFKTIRSIIDDHTISHNINNENPQGPQIGKLD